MLDQVTSGLSGHWVQCISGGHVYELPIGDPLIAISEARTYLDALILGPEDCAHCREERIEWARREIRMCGDAGCPMGERHCKRGCLAKKDLQYAENPPTGDLKIVLSSRADVPTRIAAARRLGWTVRHLRKGPRGGKYSPFVEVRNPETDERFPLI